MAEQKASQVIDSKSWLLGEEGLVRGKFLKSLIEWGKPADEGKKMMEIVDTAGSLLNKFFRIGVLARLVPNMLLETARIVDRESAFQRDKAEGRDRDKGSGSMFKTLEDRPASLGEPWPPRKITPQPQQVLAPIMSNQPSPEVLAIVPLADSIPDNDQTAFGVFLQQNFSMDPIDADLWVTMFKTIATPDIITNIKSNNDPAFAAKLALYTLPENQAALTQIIDKLKAKASTIP